MTTLKENVDTFNRDALSNEGYRYTTHCSFSSLVANRRMTEATMSRIPSGIRTIIDAGCGDGIYVQDIRLQRPDAEITGFDPAAEAIRIAQEKYPSIQFFVGDILQPSTFPEQRYDMVVVRGVLHHLSDPASAVRHCTKLSDRMLIIEPNGNNPVVKLFERFSTYHREHEEQSFSSRKLRRWCEDAGWEVAELEYIGFVPFFFPTLPSKIIYALQPMLERIPLLRRFFAGQIVIVAERRGATAADRR